MVKNLYRKLKLIFRKPKLGEFWSIDRAGKTETFRIIKKIDTGGNFYYLYSYTFKFDSGWTWEGPISQAGPIYLARNNSLEYGLDAVSKLPPKPNPEAIPIPKQGEIWMLDGYSLLVGQVEYPYISLYDQKEHKQWAGHIKDAGDIYKVEDTWLMKEVQKQAKTLEEFIR